MSETRCQQCGVPVTPGARFCMSCGADVSGEQASVATRMVGAASEARPQPRLSQADLLSLLRDDTLGDYEILAELGRGGMATVYLAHDIQLDRKVAIKVLNPGIAQGEGMVERFRLEARTAAKLSHPHIIPIHAVRETDDVVYFVMKFVVGRGLDTVMKELAPLPIPTVRSILSKVAEALGYAHRHGVVHRDIKPANIMIDAEGMPIVTDFGIAKVQDRERLTVTGAAIGTPTYMSPEQCNAGTITGASDQYSLGVMAFEMLTGRTLYAGDSFVTIMFKHCHEAPPTIENFGPSVPADLAQAVIRMLQKAPGDRWPAMEDALPSLRGSDASLDDAVRTQMIEFAKGGTNASLLARISTPRSPFPSLGGAKPDSRTPAPTTVPVRVPARRRSRAMLLVTALVVVAAAGTLAVLRPWQGSGRAAIPRPPQPIDTAAAASGGLAAESTAVAGATDQGPESLPPSPPVTATSTAQPPGAAAVPAAPVVREIRIPDPPTGLAEGATATLRAEILDQRGRPISRPVQWSSSAPTIATVGADGVVRAVAPGNVTIAAEADGRRVEVPVTVTAVVATVGVSPESGALAVGEALNLVATPRGSDARPLADRAVTWGSSDERVAVVSSTGHVTALAAGTAVIRATAEGKTGTARVTVQAPAATRPVETPPPAVENPQEAVAGVVQAYASALEAKDFAKVKALYPGFSGALERRTRDALDAMDDLRVRLVPSGITVNGNSAKARVTGAWTYRGGRLDINNQYTLERRPSGWVIASID